MDPLFQKNVSISSAPRLFPPSVTEKPELDGRKTFHMSGADISFDSAPKDTKPAKSFINEVSAVASYDFETAVRFDTPRPETSKLNELSTRAETLKNELADLPQKGLGRLATHKRREKLEISLMQTQTELKTIASKTNLSGGAGNAIDAIEYYSRVSENDYVNDDTKPMLYAENGMDLMYIGLIGKGQEGANSEAANTLFLKLAENPQADLNSSELRVLEEFGLRQNESGQLYSYGSGQIFQASDATDALGILAYQKDLSTLNANFAGTVTSRGAVSNVRDLVAMTSKSRIHFSSELSKLEQEDAVLQNKMTVLTSIKSDAVISVQNLEHKLTHLSGTVSSVKTWLQKIDGITESGQLSELIQNDPSIHAFLEDAGLDIRQVEGQATLFQNGAALSEVDALKLLSAKGKETLSALQSERAGLQDDLSQARQKLDETQVALDDLEHQVVNVRQQQSTVIEAQGEYTSNLEALQAIKNDPERWAALSSEEQKDILAELELSGPLLERARTVTESVDQHLNSATQMIIETQDFIQEATGIFEQAEQLLTVARALESQMNGALDSFDKYIQLLESGKDQQAEVNQLIDRANELSANLTLTPGVQTRDVNELIQEWQDILKETVEIFNNWSDAQSTDQQIERKRMQTNAEKLLDELKYQQNYMQNMTEHRSDQQHAYLQRVVPQLSLSLSA